MSGDEQLLGDVDDVGAVGTARGRGHPAGGAFEKGRLALRFIIVQRGDEDR